MDKDYIKVKEFISKDVADLLYGYTLLEHRRLTILNEKGIDNPILWGTFNDEQALGDFGRYGDLIFDTLLMGKLEHLEEITKDKLVPQYSYHRLYTKGTELTPHIDRPECEISVTMCLGYDGESWPIWFGNENGEKISVDMKQGDMVVYKGHSVGHWREPYKGNNNAQLFLHYTKKDGKYSDIKFDGRLALGLQNEFLMGRPIEF